jgi:hypothetical protein
MTFEETSSKNESEAREQDTSREPLMLSEGDLRKWWLPSGQPAGYRLRRNHLVGFYRNYSKDHLLSECRLSRLQPDADRPLAGLVLRAA